MVQGFWIRVLGESIPASPTNDLISNVRVHNLEPPARGIILVPAHLPVPQLFEPLPCFLVMPTIRAQKYVKGIERVLIRFALALDQLVPFVVFLDFSQFERHFDALLSRMID